MNFHPINMLTGEHGSTSSSVRESLMIAYAREMGDFDSSKYEERYGLLIDVSPSHLTGLCMLKLGDWRVYEEILARA